MEKRIDHKNSFFLKNSHTISASRNRQTKKMDNLSPITIQSAKQADVRALSLFIEPFVKAGRLLPRTTEELSDLVKTGFIAQQNKLIVGFVALEVYSSKLAEIRSLAVSPLFQSHGIGKQLIAACVQLAHEKNIREVMAITSSDQFFQSCGFDFTLPGEKKALFLTVKKGDR